MRQLQYIPLLLQVNVWKFLTINTVETEMFMHRQQALADRKREREILADNIKKKEEQAKIDAEKKREEDAKRKEEERKRLAELYPPGGWGLGKPSGGWW